MNTNKNKKEMTILIVINEIKIRNVKTIIVIKYNLNKSNK